MKNETDGERQTMIQMNARRRHRESRAPLDSGKHMKGDKLQKHVPRAGHHKMTRSKQRKTTGEVETSTNTLGNKLRERR